MIDPNSTSLAQPGPFVLNEAVRVVEIGKPVKVYRSDRQDLLAYGVVSTVMVLAGAGILLALVALPAIERALGVQLPGAMAAEWPLLLVSIPSSLVFIGGGISCWRAMLHLARLRVHLCAEGLYYEQGEELVVFPWNQLAYVRETRTWRSLRLPGLRVRLTQRPRRRYTLQRTDHVAFTFNSTNVQFPGELASKLRDATRARRIPWQLTAEWL